MRAIGLVLVVIGGVALGAWGFSYLGRSDGSGGGEPAARSGDRPGWNSPVVAGIAVVGGLLLLTSDGRRASD